MEQVNAVIYTDGSASPNPGPASGFGAYGYTWNTAEQIPKPKDTKGVKSTFEYIQMENKKYGKPEKINEWSFWGGIEGKRVSSNEAEVLAAAHALEQAGQMNLKKVEFRLDSQYALNGITKWMHTAAQRGWRRADGEEVKNKESWIKLHSAYEKNIPKFKEVQWTWVKGHNGNPGNEAADVAAKKGGALASLGEYKLRGHVNGSLVHQDPDAGEFFENWTDGLLKEPVVEGKPAPKPKKEKVIPMNRILSCAKWYFATNIERPTSKDGRTIYTMGAHSEDVFLGKPVSDDSHAVAFVKTPDPLLEKLRDRQNELADEYSDPIIANLATLRSSTKYGPYLKEGFDYAMMKRGGELRNIDGVNISARARPPLKAFMALELLDRLTVKLESYVAKTDDIQITDITDLFYEDVEKKTKKKTTIVRKLKESMINTVKSVRVDAAWKNSSREGTAKLVLTLGQDLPPRNTLSGLASEIEKVSVITWADSDHSIRYAVVLETTDDVVLHCAGFSNMCLV